MGLADEPILVGEDVQRYSNSLIEELGVWTELVDLSRFGLLGPWVVALSETSSRRRQRSFGGN